MMTCCPRLSVAIPPPQNRFYLSSQPPRLSLNNRFLVHPRLRCQYTRNSSSGGENKDNFGLQRDTGGGDHDTSPFWYKGQLYEYVVVDNNVITPLDQYIQARSPPPSDSSVVCSNPSFFSILNQLGVISKPSWILEVMTGCLISWLFEDD